MVIIKNNQLLTSFTKKGNFYFYIGGHLEFGETVLEGCQREIKEECGKDTKFIFKKILYIRDFFDKERNEQNLELFILGDLDKSLELEGKLDPQHKDGSMWLSWLNIKRLPNNLYPKTLSKKLLKDYIEDFPNSGEYVGEIR